MFLPLLILLVETIAAEADKVSVTESSLILEDLIGLKFTVSTICDVGYGLPLYNISETSLLQCCTACSSDEACQSITYDGSSRECRMSAAEALNPSDTGCDSEVVYAKFAMAANSTECTDDANCTWKNQVCKNGHCACRWEYRYNPRNDSCSPGCAKYGNEFHHLPSMRLGQNNDKKIPNVTVEQAKQACLNETAFMCISIDCYGFGDYCALSKNSIVTMFKNTIKEDGYEYYQRKCE